MKLNKRKVKKALALILSLVIFINFIVMIFGTNTAFAVVPEIDTSGGPIDAVLTGIGSGLTGLTLIIVSLFRFPILLIGYLLKILMNSIVTVSTFDIASNIAITSDIAIEHILFSGYEGGSFKAVDLADINFFNLNTGNPTIDALRSAIAQWYYIMRLIAAAILLVILIYVGIRMAISTIASEQAKYKQMLVDWATSLALLFLLHYIIIFIIQINSSLVRALGGFLTAYTKDGQTIGQILNTAIVRDIWTSLISGIIASIIYVVIQFMVFRFFLFYLKRMITVGFLIIIAPLITITYSIDKMGDGKAQALNTWLKELTYNILIQPFHCVLYLAFFGAIYQLVTSAEWFGSELLQYVFAFVVLNFMQKAEDILRKIFHFQANSMAGISEPAQNFMNATGRFAKMGMGVGKAVSNFRAAGGVSALKGGFQDMKARRQVKKDFEDKKIEGTEGQTFQEFKKTEQYEKKVAEKVSTNAAEQAQRTQGRRNDKAQKIYDKQPGHNSGDYDKKIDAEAKKAYEKENPGKNYDALSNEEKEKYREKPREKLTRETLASGTKTRKTITGVKKVGSKVGETGKKVWEAGKEFSNMRVGKAAIGLLKDSTKVASAIAFGAAAYGVTGQMNDAISMGQLGYGLTSGVFENTTRTLEKDSGDLFTQYAINHNMTPEQMKAFAQELANQCDAENIAGMFKNLGDQINKMEQSLEKILGDNALELVSQIRIKTANGEQYDIEQMLNECIDKNQLDISDEKREEALSTLIDASDLTIKSMIAGTFAKLESTTGMDVDSYGRRSSKYINEQTIINMIDQRKNVQNTTNNTTNTTNNNNYQNTGNPNTGNPNTGNPNTGNTNPGDSNNGQNTNP